MQRILKTEYLGVQEAEAVTGISKWTWRRWAYDGKIESLKLGKRLLIPRLEIDRLVSAGTRPRLEAQR
jgi:excisionase family DNA binding protein